MGAHELARGRTKKLIEAAANCARHGERPPIELRIAWDAKKWGALPEGGGMMDQDYGLMQRMNAVDNIYSTLARLQNMQGAQIHNLTDAERRLLGTLKDMGLLYG